MTHWVILRRDNTNDYLNLDVAEQIIHQTQTNARHNSFVVQYANERVTIRNDQNPATYAHISAYLGIPEDAG